MPLPDPQKIADRFTELYGLPLVSAPGADADGNPYFDFSPDGVHKNDAFTIRIKLGWRSLSGEFIPGAYSSAMVQEMGRAPEQDTAVFAGIISKLVEGGGQVSMKANDVEAVPTDPSQWPDDWRRLEISIAKSPLAVNTENSSDTEQAILRWGGRFIAAILSLAPLEELEVPEDVNPDSLPEGAVSRIEVNKYERSKFNRAACIEIHGCTCKACGFDFERVYGEIGRGYIHVHHVTPVSEIGEGYLVNPVTDLVPLCPNCHAMAHTQSPPLSVEGLIALFR